MNKRFRFVLSIAIGLVLVAAAAPTEASPEGTLTVAVATFGNERWLPNLYVGAEDVVLKPMFENLLTRDAKGELAPSLAERWQVLDGGKTWKFHLRKGVRFHNGAELSAEDVRFTFTTLAKEGSANSLAPEFRLIKSMEVENPYTLTVRFDKPSVVFGNKVNQGLFASTSFIQSKRHIETAGEQGAERQPIGTGPWKFVEHIRGDRIVYEAVDHHWRQTPHWKRLVILKVPEPATRMAMLRAGSVDVIEVGGEYVDELKKVGVRKRRPVDRAVFAADFRARAYSGVTLAYAAPLVAPEPWEVLYRGGYTKASLSLFMEHPKLDEFIDRLAVQPNHAERVRIMREEMLPWLSDYVPGVAIGAMHAIAGVGPKVGEWPLIPGHMGFHNWEYVTRAK